MAGVLVNIIASVFLVSLVSFIGIVTLSVKRELLNKVLAAIAAFGAGTLIGSAFFELVPESIEIGGSAAPAYIIFGIVVFLVMERLIHWHHHHHHGDHAQHHEGKARPFAYLNILGEVTHNFIDGTIIAASYITSLELGIITTAAIIFHEIPQEMGDFGILIHGGFPVRKALFYNFLAALTAVIGGIAAFLYSGIGGLNFILLSIAGGGFLYIALASLIPEINREGGTKKAIGSIVFIIAGIIVMYWLGAVFPE